MIVCFTGTRRGMTAVQIVVVERLMENLQVHVVHHGAAEGADRQMHHIAGAYGCHRELYPCTTEQARWAKSAAGETDVVHPEDNHGAIQRNHRMADKSGVIIATPYGFVEIPRGSGTWATIRYAWKIGKPCYVIYPTGELRGPDKPAHIHV
jgi:hypothetical protein